jgi:hypothetical protein
MNIEVICCHCGKTINSGYVVVVGRDIMGGVYLCSPQCLSAYQPTVLTAAKLRSFMARWPKKEPSEDLQPS